MRHIAFTFLLAKNWMIPFVQVDVVPFEFRRILSTWCDVIVQQSGLQRTSVVLVLDRDLRAYWFIASISSRFQYVISLASFLFFPHLNEMKCIAQFCCLEDLNQGFLSFSDAAFGEWVPASRLTCSVSFDKFQPVRVSGSLQRS